MTEQASDAPGFPEHDLMREAAVRWLRTQGYIVLAPGQPAPCNTEVVGHAWQYAPAALQGTYSHQCRACGELRAKR